MDIKKGLVITLLNMCSYLVSSLAVFIFFKPVHTYLCESAVGKSVAKTVSEKIAERFSGVSVLNLPLPLIFGKAERARARLSRRAVRRKSSRKNVTNALFFWWLRSFCFIL
ncbi:MAG: hypothetical protein L6V93_21290 [Clostridiales bacterium]|nr:MAG: hypothetical protein L6V93_21290 [Clostridiales bacterium]